MHMRRTACIGNDSVSSAEAQRQGGMKNNKRCPKRLQGCAHVSKFMSGLKHPQVSASSHTHTYTHTHTHTQARVYKQARTHNTIAPTHIQKFPCSGSSLFFNLFSFLSVSVSVSVSRSRARRVCTLSHPLSLSRTLSLSLVLLCIFFLSLPFFLSMCISLFFYLFPSAYPCLSVSVSDCRSVGLSVSFCQCVSRSGPLSFFVCISVCISHVRACGLSLSLSPPPPPPMFVQACEHKQNRHAPRCTQYSKSTST